MNKKLSGNKDFEEKEQSKKDDIGYELADLFNSLCEEAGDDTEIFYEPENEDNN